MAASNIKDAVWLLTEAIVLLERQAAKKPASQERTTVRYAGKPVVWGGGGDGASYGTLTSAAPYADGRGRYVRTAAARAKMAAAQRKRWAAVRANKKKGR